MASIDESVSAVGEQVPAEYQSAPSPVEAPSFAVDASEPVYSGSSPEPYAPPPQSSPPSGFAPTSGQIYADQPQGYQPAYSGFQQPQYQPQQPQYPQYQPQYAPAYVPQPDPVLEAIRPIVGNDFVARYDNGLEAAGALARAASSNAAYADIGRKMAPYMAEFMEWKRQQEDAAAAAAAAEPQDWWNPPQIEQSWLNEVIEENGQLFLRQGSTVSPTVVDRIREYIQYQKDWSNRLVTNPKEALEPVIQEAVNRSIDASKKMFKRYEERLRARDILARNKPALIGPDGQPNQRFSEYTQILKNLQDKGIVEPELSNDIAMMMIDYGETKNLLNQYRAWKDDVLRHYGRQQAAPAGYQPPSISAVAPPSGYVAPPASKPASLKDEILHAVRQAGINDNNFSLE